MTRWHDLIVDRLKDGGLGLLWQMRRVAAESVSNHTAQAVPERKV